MNRRAAPSQTPYDFNRSVMFPFKSGSNSVAFVFKSAALYALVTTVLFLIFGKWIFGAFMEMATYIGMLAAESGEPELSQFLEMFSYFGKIMLPIMIVSLGGWFVMAIIEASFYRRVFNGENKTYPWRFGRDEVRVMLSQLIFGLVVFGLVALFYILIGIVAFLMVNAESGGNDVGGDLAAVFALIMFVGFIVVFPVTIFLAVRLSPIAALSVLREKISIKETWQVTQGRFWPVVGSFVIVAVLAYIINYVIQTIMMLGMLGNFSTWVTEFEDVESAEPEMLIQAIIDIVTQPSFLIVLAIVIFIFSVVQLVVRLLYSGITANAVDLYRQDLGENDLEVFD